MGRGVHSLKHLICLCTLDKVIMSVKFSFLGNRFWCKFWCGLGQHCQQSTVRSSFLSFSSIIDYSLFLGLLRTTSVRLQQLTVQQFLVQPSAPFPTVGCSAYCSCKRLLVLCSTLIASAASSFFFFFSSSTSACLRSFSKNSAYLEWACLNWMN